MNLNHQHGTSYPATATQRAVGTERTAEPMVALVPGAILRLTAAVAYLGVMSILISLARPDRRFLARHTRLALVLHLLRAVAVIVPLVIFWRADRLDPAYDRSELLTDIGLLLLAGLPRLETISGDLLPWAAYPIALLWGASAVGLVLAAMGRTADFSAFASADWSDVVPHWHRRAVTPEEERRLARMARERQLEKLQRSTRTIGVERTRRERMGEIEDRIERLQAEQEHINQLLALGEMSQRRYDSLAEDIEAELLELRNKLAELSQRSVAPSQVPAQLRVNRLDRTPESEVDTVAIVTPSGVPLFTYGAFALDEALVAGILSAFDSISEEVFGSRVHKTELAEGQVLHFAHGQHVVILAIFAEEPSPRQIEQLRTMLRQFEAANRGPLSRQQYDPHYLIEVHPPFTFRVSSTSPAPPAPSLPADVEAAFKPPAGPPPDDALPPQR